MACLASCDICSYSFFLYICWQWGLEVASKMEEMDKGKMMANERRIQRSFVSFIYILGLVLSAFASIFYSRRWYRQWSLVPQTVLWHYLVQVRFGLETSYHYSHSSYAYNPKKALIFPFILDETWRWNSDGWWDSWRREGQRFLAKLGTSHLSPSTIPCWRLFLEYSLKLNHHKFY